MPLGVLLVEVRGVPRGVPTDIRSNRLIFLPPVPGEGELGAGLSGAALAFRLDAARLSILRGLCTPFGCIVGDPLGYGNVQAQSRISSAESSGGYR